MWNANDELCSPKEENVESTNTFVIEIVRNKAKMPSCNMNRPSTKHYSVICIEQNCFNF